MTRFPLQVFWAMCAIVAACHPAVASDPSVQAGIDILEQEKFSQLSGRNVGLITNHTGVNLKGVSTVKLLHDASNVHLKTLFSPEHGFAGLLDQANVNDDQDTETGLEIISLYGKTRVPTDESLKGIDTLVFDIQDIGTRFYTYISTMGGAMRAAAKNDITFVVLDRPNPIGGSVVGGPILDAGKESFVGYHTIAVRHGMTIGEIAMMFRSEMNLDLDLRVIHCQGWKREMAFDETGMVWINPSPNMRNLTQAFLYPGIGLLETTNLSVGRGTDTPFEVLGSPWIDSRTFAAALNTHRLGGIRFVPLYFEPDASKYAGQRCGGVNMIVTDRESFDPIRTGIVIATTLRQLYPDQWKTKSLNRLLGNQGTFEAIKAGQSFKEIQLGYQPRLDAFIKRRQPFLIY